MKRLAIFSVFALLCLAFLRPERLLTEFALFFTIDNATPGASAILVLSGRNETRIPKAVELYRQNYAPRILLSTPALRRNKFNIPIQPDTEVARSIVAHMQPNVQLELVPSTKGGATSTFDEAYDMLEFSRNENLERIIIVTDSFHTRRALLAFNKVMKDTRIEIEISAATNDIFDERNWWKSEFGLTVYLAEPIKLAYYLLQNDNMKSISNY